MLHSNRGGERNRPQRVASWALGLAVLAYVASGASAAQGAEPGHTPVAEAATTAPLPFELTSVAHPSLAAQIAYFSGPGRRQAAALISRAGTLGFELWEALASAGAPAELIWVAALESGFEPKAGSRAGAAGLWQFMPAAADGFGLVRDSRVDERRHVRAATEAAARLLMDLRREFGSWPLALAAYNMGPYGLRERLAGQTPTDFWSFERNRLLAGSVRRYPAKILALAVVASAPERYGLAGLQPLPPREVAEFVLPAETTAAAFARSAGVSLPTLRALNPWLLGTLLLPGDSVYLPPASMEALRKAGIEALGTAGVRSETTLFGEEVDDLAERFGVKSELLRQLNGWARGFEPEYETQFLVPATAPTSRASTERPVVTLPALPFSFTDRVRWFYRVTRRDSLEALAARVGLTVEDVSLWNDLDPKLPMRTGSMITLWLPLDQSPEGLLLLPESGVVIAGQAKAAGGEASAKQSGDSTKPRERHRRRSHAVKAGETLSSIARRYRVRVADLRRWNDLEEDEVILVGQPLLVGR